MDLIYIVHSHIGTRLAVCQRHLGYIDGHVNGGHAPAGLICVFCSAGRVVVQASEADGVDADFINGCFPVDPDDDGWVGGAVRF